MKTRKQATPVISREEARSRALENLMPFIREQIAAFDDSATRSTTPDPANCRRIANELRKIARSLEPKKGGIKQSDESPDEIRIRRAFAQMPFAGALNLDFGGLPDPATIADNLERLREGLDAHADADRKRDGELVEYGQAVAGFGRLLRLAAANAPTEGETDLF